MWTTDRPNVSLLTAIKGVVWVVITLNLSIYQYMMGITDMAETTACQPRIYDGNY